MADEHQREETSWLESVWGVVRRLEQDSRYEVDAQRLRETLRGLSHALSRTLEGDYAGGRKSALPEAIYVCSLAGITLPEWAATLFCAGREKIENAEVGSWDEIFGHQLQRRQHRRGKRYDSAKTQRAQRKRIYRRVQNRSPGEAIDDSLFNTIAEEIRAEVSISISGRTVKRLYHQAVDENNRMNEWLDSREGSEFGEFLERIFKEVSAQ